MRRHNSRASFDTKVDMNHALTFNRVLVDLALTHTLAGSSDGTQALSTRERLRPDVELQRLRSRDERHARHRRLRRTRRRSVAIESRAVGRRADLSHPARSGIPPRPTQ